MTTTPAQFLSLLTGSQEERDAAQKLKPEPGQIILLRNGRIPGLMNGDFGLIQPFTPLGLCWRAAEELRIDEEPYKYDCIATLDLETTLAELVSYRRKIAWSLAQREKAE